MLNISESLKKQRELILADSSEEMFSRHTSLLEIAVISLYNRLANRLNLDSEQFRSSGAVASLGGFGRGLVGPGQPVPILFVMSESFSWKESWLDEIASPLTEAGWIVDLQYGSVEALLNRAREDFPFFLRLLEIRYISGSRQLVEQIDKGLESFIEERRDRLLEQVFDSVRAGHARFDDPGTWLEPDIYGSPGALDEINCIRTACRIASNVRNLEDAIFRGLLVRQEVDLLQQAEKTYARLLNLLGGSSPGDSGILRFDRQEALAAKLGYSARAGFLPVEAFMQQIYQLFQGVLCISEEFWERLHESRLEEQPRGEAEAERLEEGLTVRARKIYVQTDRYPATSSQLVRLFRLAAEHRLGMANVTRQWVRHHRNVLDAAAGDSKVREELLKLIRADSPDLPYVRQFYNQGLLTSLIPELSAVHGLVQHDAFHLYPVQEHHLRVLGELKKLLAGDYADAEPQLTQIAQGIGDPVLLFLAGLLHDIGKSSGKDHALHGGEMIPTIARRLGLSPDESDAIQFLVAQHLVLMDSASMRDLADEEMLAQCALITRTTEQLDLLVALSFADMAATGPKAREKWRDTPVLALYDRVRRLLEKGEPSHQAISERIDHVRAQVGREVGDLMDGVELEAYFSQLAPRYLLSMPPGAIARHVRLQWQLRQSKDTFVSEIALTDGSAEITLLSWEMPGLLSKAAGILTLHDMNIIGAQVFTMDNDLMLLIFHCRWLEKGDKAPNRKAIQDDLHRLLEGKLALDYRIAAHAADQEALHRPSPRRGPSQIVIDNESSELYSILEVYTIDRPGLLYTITRTLFEIQLRIYVAKITTKVDQVADVFYVRTREGAKVTDPEQMEEIRKALRFWLDGPTTRQELE